ncbi:hypothetical protein Bca52824_016029 [Brassica carinata]|uniref:Uncharacterized protein n=1 Tax=Brassica carinata TaxID=52824 RepID=A0A8X7W3Q9_BRACI|nr:hypothetical protein Bca52824_016029 [Brassica carinata]
MRPWRAQGCGRSTIKRLAAHLPPFKFACSDFGRPGTSGVVEILWELTCSFSILRVILIAEAPVSQSYYGVMEDFLSEGYSGGFFNRKLSPDMCQR